MSQVPNPYAPPKTPISSLSAANAQHAELASLWQRFVGSLVDGVIMLVLVLPLAFGMGMVLAVIGDPNSLSVQIMSQILGAAIGIGAFLVLNGYLLATQGQTIGKMLVGTKIVSDDGTLMPFGPLILKRYVPLWLVVQIPFVGNLIALVNSLMIFRSNRKCLHDDIAGTKVIRLNG